MPDFPINPISMDGYLQSLSAAAIRDLMSEADSEGKFIQFLPGNFVPVTPAASSATGSAASGISSQDVDPGAQGSIAMPETAVPAPGTGEEPADPYSFVDRYIPGDEVPARLWTPYSPAQNLASQPPTAGAATLVLQAYAAAQGPLAHQPRTVDAGSPESPPVQTEPTDAGPMEPAAAGQLKAADTGLPEPAALLRQNVLAAMTDFSSEPASQTPVKTETQAAPVLEKAIGMERISSPIVTDLDTFFLPLKDMVDPMAELKNTQILQLVRGNSVPLLEFDAPHTQQVLGRLLSAAVGFSTGEITLITDTQQAVGNTDVQLRFILQAQMDLPAVVTSYFNENGALPVGPPLENLALNLTLCRQLASLMHGNLAVRSDVDGNALFYLDLPARRGGAGGKRSAREIGRFSGRRILLAMPDSLEFHRVSELLHKREMLPDAAGTPEDAIRLFAKSPLGYYDAVISAFGGKFLGQLRQADREDAPIIPILVLLAEPTPAALSSAFENGCSSCLPFSFTGSQFFNTLGLLLI